jgi:hypothetical protein
MKYVFNTQLNIEKEIFSASSSGWDLRKTIHRIMKKLINAVEHKFHIEGQKQQQFHPKKAKRGFGKSIKLKIKGLVKFW